MIDTLMNLLFRCAHRRLTSPMTRVSVPHGDALVVCLDCGKQFEYDVNAMRIGKAIDHSDDAGVVPPRRSMSPATKFKYAVLAAVPVALVIGAAVKGKKSGSQKNAPMIHDHGSVNPIAPDEADRKEPEQSD